MHWLYQIGRSQAAHEHQPGGQVAALLRLRGDFALRPIPRTLAALAGTQAGVVVVVGTDRVWADRG